MVKHIVMFKLKAESGKQQAIHDFKMALEALPAVIEPLECIEVGVNANPLENWDVVLTATLPTMADVEVYAKHPAHVAAAAIVAPFKEARACVDYEL